MTERSWRCAAVGCRDSLTVQSAITDDGVPHLRLSWGRQTGSLRERLGQVWRLLFGRGDDWYDLAVADPAVARDLAAWLTAGADHLEQEDR